MAARQARPRPRPLAALAEEIDDEFWGPEYPPVARSLLTFDSPCKLGTFEPHKSRGAFTASAPHARMAANMPVVGS